MEQQQCQKCFEREVKQDKTDDNIIRRLKAMLEETKQFENFECNYDPTLGTCGNKGCLHCNVMNLIQEYESEKANKEIN